MLLYSCCMFRSVFVRRLLVCTLLFLHFFGFTRAPQSSPSFNQSFFQPVLLSTSPSFNRFQIFLPFVSVRLFCFSANLFRLSSSVHFFVRSFTSLTFHLSFLLLSFPPVFSSSFVLFRPLASFLLLPLFSFL
eukprot:TRINITY_DN88_c0_g2_i14.p1 TRINITY_DN88_c0_g2~~TRINITY_DN88_c0_g2_i14.p1  ORF type:complete len:132 (+),score=13.09 TRINITY_DN88_c0_g2_i14:637-1032(+)